MYRHVGFLVLVAACTKPNPDVCCTSADDCASIGATGATERPCQSGLVCVDHACAAPQICTGPSACLDPSLPFCIDGACTGCPDSSVCPATAPFCDTSTHDCRACKADDECATAVCDVQAGTCVDSLAIAYASPSGPDTAPCTQIEPCSFASAVAATNPTRRIVKLAAGTYTPPFVTIAGAGRDITIDGPDAILQTSVGTDFLLKVVDGLSLRVIGVEIIAPLAFKSDSSAQGHPTISFEAVTLRTDYVRIARSTARFTRSRIFQRPQFGIFETVGTAGAPPDCAVTFERSLFDGGDGFSVADAVLRISSSVIANQFDVDGALHENQNASVTVESSTIYNSLLKQGGTFRDTIVYNPRGTATSNTASSSSSKFDFCLVSPQLAPLAGNNNLLGMDPKLVDPAHGDYHLRLGSPAIDAADPALAPMADYDGTARPVGSRSDMGALEFRP